MSIPSDNNHERRKFTRIPFEASVHISSPEGNWTGKLIDVSLNGVLITRPQNWITNKSKQVMIEICPAEQVFSIRMEVSVTHSENDRVGMRCEHIDIDSVSHLRRLVELNVGDDDILNRELSALISSAA